MSSQDQEEALKDSGEEVLGGDEEVVMGESTDAEDNNNLVLHKRSFTPREYVPLGVKSLEPKILDIHDPFKAAIQIKEEGANIAAEVAIMEYLKAKNEDVISREEALTKTKLEPQKFDMAIARLQHREVVYVDDGLGVDKLLRLVTPAIVIKTLLANTLKIVYIEKEMEKLKSESRENKQEIEALSSTLSKTKEEMEELRTLFEEKGLLKKELTGNKEAVARLIGTEAKEGPQIELLTELVWEVILEGDNIKKVANQVIEELSQKESLVIKLEESLKQLAEKTRQNEELEKNILVLSTQESQIDEKRGQRDESKIQELLQEKTSLQNELDNAIQTCTLLKEEIERTKSEFLEEQQKLEEEIEKNKASTEMIFALNQEIANNKSSIEKLKEAYILLEEENQFLKEKLPQPSQEKETFSGHKDGLSEMAIDNIKAKSNKKTKGIKILIGLVVIVVFAAAALMVVGTVLNSESQQEKISNTHQQLNIVPVQPQPLVTTAQPSAEYVPQGVSPKDIVDIAQKTQDETPQNEPANEQILKTPEAPSLPRSQQSIGLPHETKVNLSSHPIPFSTVLKIEELKKQEFAKSLDGLVINGKKFKQNDEVFGYKIIRITDNEALLFSIALKTPHKIQF